MFRSEKELSVQTRYREFHEREEQIHIELFPHSIVLGHLQEAELVRVTVEDPQYQGTHTVCFNETLIITVINV